MSIIIFMLAMWSAPGVDGPARVPPSLSFAVAVAAAHHQGDPHITGAVMVAENRSRRFDPLTVGRYGRGGEQGVMQVARDPWTREVMERCAPAHRAGHHRYDGMTDCLTIGSRPPDFFDAAQNVESAVIVLGYMHSKMRSAHPLIDDWLAMYRCRPAAYVGRSSPTPPCARSVARVRAWQSAIITEQHRLRSWLGGFMTSTRGHDDAG